MYVCMYVCVCVYKIIIKKRKQKLCNVKRGLNAAHHRTNWGFFFFWDRGTIRELLFYICVCVCTCVITFDIYL